MVKIIRIFKIITIREETVIKSTTPPTKIITKKEISKIMTTTLIVLINFVREIKSTSISHKKATIIVITILILTTTPHISAINNPKTITKNYKSFSKHKKISSILKFMKQIYFKMANFENFSKNTVGQLNNNNFKSYSKLISVILSITNLITQELRI